MSATVLQFRLKPKQEKPRDQDTAPSETIPYGGKGIDGMGYFAPEEDPA